MANLPEKDSNQSFRTFGSFIIEKYFLVDIWNLKTNF